VPLPVNKYLETFSHSDMEHRPFLGVSVDGPSKSVNKPVGIIRILRKSGSKPFVKTDGVILQRLAREIHPLFLTWEAERRANLQNHLLLCGARFPFAIRVVGQSPTPMKLEAIDRLGREFPPGAIWNRRKVNSVLVDLITIYRNGIRKGESQGGLIANFRLSHPRSTSLPPGEAPYRIFAIHRIRSVDPPTPKEIADHEEPGESIGLLTIERKCPVTFDPRQCKFFRGLLLESKDVTSGVCMPTRFLCPSGVVRGVVSLDCDDMNLSHWRSEHLEVVALTARQLDFIGRNNCFCDETIYDCENWTTALYLFLTQTLVKAGVSVSNIVHSDGRHFYAGLKPDAEAALMKVTQSLPEQPFDTADDVKCNWKGGFRMDLWYSAFKTKLTLFGLLDEATLGKMPGDMYLETMKVKLVEISQLWNRFTSSRIGIGVKSLFTLSFREVTHPQGGHLDGVTIWEPQLQLGPDLFRRSREGLPK
jgi:hypothetical protein